MALAALVLVFWGEPTVLFVIVLVTLLLIVLGLIELIGRPPAQPETAAVHDDRDHTERPGVEPGPVAEPGDVPGLIGVVADQQRLRAGIVTAPTRADSVAPRWPLSRSGRVASVVPRLSSR